MVEDNQLVSLLRRMRHDFANHLQVMSGYVDLGWDERLAGYIRSVIAELNQERIIFEAVEAEAALYLYEQLLMIKDLGIILIYEEMDFQSVKLLTVSNEPLKSIAAMQADILPVAGEEDAVVYLSVYESEAGIDLLFACDNWEEETRRVSIIRE